MIHGRSIPLFSILILLSIFFPPTWTVAQERAKEEGVWTYLVPYAGMLLASAPGQTLQAYGVAAYADLSRHLALGWRLEGHWEGGASRGGGVGGDLLWRLGGGAGAPGAETLAGAFRWKRRTVYTVGFRGRGGLNLEALQEERGGTIPPIQFVMEVRGGVSMMDDSEGGRSRGILMAYVALSLPMRLGVGHGRKASEGET